MISPSAVHALTSSVAGREARSTMSEWYRVASKGEGRPSKRPRPSWRMGDVLPCIRRSARTTRPPYACPMAWWPRQTPKMGSSAPRSRRTASEMPASFGVHGPGEMRMPWGARARMPATSMPSFLKTSTLAPSSPRYWTRLKVNES